MGGVGAVIRRSSVAVAAALVASACAAYGWGVGEYGQLGDGRADDWTLPVEVHTVGTAVSMEIGGSHGCVIDTADKLWCWGRNTGTIGNGNSIEVPEPVQIGTASWTSVSAGNQGTCGIQVGGTLWCWGDISPKQLVPSQVGTDTDWASVSYGNLVRCAIKTDTSLWCWGRNDQGQVGDGTTVNKPAPVHISPGTTWDEVQAGWLKTCGRQTDGSVWCWGYNLWGQLGDGTTTNRLVPTRVGTSNAWTGLGTDQSGSHTCALQGTDLWCWGANFYSELGDGTTTNRSSPVASQAGVWRSVSMGGIHTCGVRTDDTLWCWGGNDDGELANGTMVANTPHPVANQVGGAEWATVEAGQQHVCGHKLDGTVWCWGRDRESQLGNGQPDAAALTAIAPGDRWYDLGAGAEHACGVTNSRTLECWGRNTAGQLGLGFVSNLESARTQVGTATDWAQVSAATGDRGRHTCATRTDDTLWCWGSNSTGQLGDGTETDRSSPNQVAGAWALVDVADDYSCGIRTDASLWCWGWSGFGRLGSPGGQSTVPRQVDPGSQWRSVSLGEDWHNCGIRVDTTLWCWGTGPGAGYPDEEGGSTNVPVQMGAATGWDEVASGRQHSCATRDDRTLWCWGTNWRGQVGDGTETKRLTPVQVDPSRDWILVAAGNDRSCAIADGAGPADPNELFCWGEDILPPSVPTWANTPTLVPHAANWQLLDIGEEYLLGGGL